MKEVTKPWGKEVWLELNDRYCFKRIHLNAGNRTSLQYHRQKLETSYFLEGQAEVWLENELGELEKRMVGPSDSFTVLPLRKHRVIAITDTIYLEASTPEVDDIVRVQDDTYRPDGRIDSEHK